MITTASPIVTIETDIPDGITLVEWRRLRREPSARSFSARARRLLRLGR